MYSTKYWDITTSTGDRYNFTSPGTADDVRPRLRAQRAGYGGFEIDVQRYIRRVGDPTLLETENLHRPTSPSDTVICKP